MGLGLGNISDKNIFLGSSQVKRIYEGTDKVYQGFGPASEQEFIQQEATGGPAQLLKVYGKSIVWNQLMASGDTLSVDNSEGTSAVVRHSVDADRARVPNHKYLCAANFNGQATSDTIIYMGFLSAEVINLIPGPAILSSTASSSEIKFGIYVRVPAGGSIQGTITPVAIDLTLLYGAGNEPTSVAQFEADYPTYNPAYDPGFLQSNKTAELRAERVPIINVWDEEWESGYIREDGAEIYSPLHIKSAHLIPILPATKYWFKKPARIVQRQAYYDANGDFLSLVDLYATSGSGGQFTTPSNAHYLNFYLSQNTYAGDVCINLFDPAINGQYFPHWRGSLALNLSTLTGKLNGEGASVVVYPDGLRGVGTDRDAAYGSTGEVARAVVDLGMLNWSYVVNKQVFTANSPNDSAEVVESYGISALCAKYSKTKADTLWGGQSPDKSFVMNGGFWTSGKRIGIKDTAYTDAATFKAAMSGVMLDYPLATPLTYTLDTPLPTDLTCEQGDILQRVSDNNCPFVGEMRYAL